MTLVMSTHSFDQSRHMVKSLLGKGHKYFWTIIYSSTGGYCKDRRRGREVRIPPSGAESSLRRRQTSVSSSPGPRPGQPQLSSAAPQPTRSLDPVVVWLGSVAWLLPDLLLLLLLPFPDPFSSSLCSKACEFTDFQAFALSLESLPLYPHCSRSVLCGVWHPDSPEGTLIGLVRKYAGQAASVGQSYLTRPFPVHLPSQSGCPQGPTLNPDSITGGHSYGDVDKAGTKHWS